MIKFFRRIRQRLITEGHLSKYIIYAIGEILLVVVGILIALQINKWNQNRNDRELERNYLERLHFEISQDTSLFKIQISRNEDRKRIIELFSSGLNEETILTSDLLNKAEDFFHQGWLIPTFTYHKSTFEDLNSTGKLSIIRNIRLRDDIISFYRAYEENSKKFDLNDTWITPIDAVLSTETAAFSYDHRTKFLFGNEESITDLRRNKDLYLRGAASHYWVILSSIGMLNEILLSAENTLTELEEELKQIQ